MRIDNEKINERNTKEESELENERAERKSYYKRLMDDWNNHTMTKIIKNIMREIISEAEEKLMSTSLSSHFYEKLIISMIQTLKDYRWILSLSEDEITEWFEEEESNINNEEEVDR